jgi:NAD(P)-dependent dehydrogenase (short-subunit alcohol dehydrogenase family)
MMRDKQVLITGASSGIGLAMAIELGKLGASVLMVSRDPERAREAQRKVARVATGAQPTVLLADLASQADVRRLVADLRASTPHLDVLINNAGAAFRQRQLSIDGIERTLATNHVAPFLLTTLLLDRVRAAPEGRIVNVTSGSHIGAIDLDNLELERGYRTLRAYSLSKACNILFTYELARRLEGTRVTANCFDPGPTESNFGASAGGFLSVVQRALGLFRVLRSAQVSGRAGVHLASSPEAAGITGKYFARNGKPAKSKPVTYDREVAKRLWALSEALCSRRSTAATAPASSEGHPTRSRNMPSSPPDPAASGNLGRRSGVPTPR